MLLFKLEFKKLTYAKFFNNKMDFKQIEDYLGFELSDEIKNKLIGK